MSSPNLDSTILVFTNVGCFWFYVKHQILVKLGIPICINPRSSMVIKAVARLAYMDENGIQK